MEFLFNVYHLIKPNYDLYLQFEFDNPERWTRESTIMDMSKFAETLRPE